MATQSSYVIEATGWHITEGHADWMESDEPLASRDDVRAAYHEVETLIRPFAQYRIVGLLHDDVGKTEYTPVEGGTGVRLLISPSGMSVETFEVCVADEISYGLVDACDCGACTASSDER